VLADVLQPGGGEHGVDQRVQRGVAVAVTGQPAVVLHLDARQHQRPALNETM